MLEKLMSVWSTAVPTSLPLAGAEGALVSVSVSVEPRRLEQLLDALAQLEFPINPAIYHDGPATLVEFPAYENRLPEIRQMLESRGFPAACMNATAMLEQLHSHAGRQAAPTAGETARAARDLIPR
jgi:hypothetical protein